MGRKGRFRWIIDNVDIPRTRDGVIFIRSDSGWRFSIFCDFGHASRTLRLCCEEPSLPIDVLNWAMKVNVHCIMNGKTHQLEDILYESVHDGSFAINKGLYLGEVEDIGQAKLELKMKFKIASTFELDTLDLSNIKESD